MRLPDFGQPHLVSKKVAYCRFFEFFSCFASRIRSRAAKPAKYENIRVFILFDAHVVKTGINLRGCGPLTTPRFFDKLMRLSDFGQPHLDCAPMTKAVDADCQSSIFLFSFDGL